MAVAALLLAVTTACSRAPNFSADATFVSVPFDYDVVPNVTYVHRPNWEGKLDLFLPASRSQATQTLVWFHGGGCSQRRPDRAVRRSANRARGGL
jgi:hypothetical protein